MNSTQDLGAFLAASLENLSEDPAEALQQIANIRDKLSRFATDDNYDNASKQLEAETHWRLGSCASAEENFHRE